MGPASGDTRAVVLQELSAAGAHVEDSLAALGVDHRDCLEKQDFAERLLSAVPHVLLIRATREAAAACRTALPMPAKEAAALQALLAAVQAEPPDCHPTAATVQNLMLGGQLVFLAAPCYWLLAAKVQGLLGRPLEPPGSSPGPASAAASAASGSSAGAAGDGASRLHEDLKAAAMMMVERAAALEGRRASDLHPDVAHRLYQLAGAFLAQCACCCGGLLCMVGLTTVLPSMPAPLCP